METPALFLEIPATYNAKELGLPWRDVMGEGVVGAGDLAVSQRAAGANMSVDVAAGAVWVLGDQDAVTQPCYRCRNDAVVNLAIAAADPTNPRKDIVIAEVLDSQFIGSSNLWRLRVVTGTPAGSPAEPALPASAHKLAVINVAAAASSVVNANITDARVRATAGGVPTAGIIDYGAPVAPTGFLLCDGSAVSRTQFAALFALLGTSYGPGDGSTTFNLPDARGRVVVGYAPSGGHTDVSTLGNNDGVAVANRRPKHRHTPHSHALVTNTLYWSGAFASVTSPGGSGVGNESATSTADGGSGNANDALDAPAYIVATKIIKT